MKPKTTQSEPPAVAGGLTQPSTNEVSTEAALKNTPLQPPATAGGSDSATAGGSDSLDALKAENEQLRTQMRLDKAHRQITGELEEAGARSPELLLSTIGGDVQFGEEGEILNSAALLDRLKSRFPEQFGRDIPQSIDGGAGLAGTPRLTKEALRRMKPAEIAELDWADVRRVLSS